MDFKTVIDRAINVKRFSIKKCINFEEYLDSPQSEECKTIQQKLSPEQYKAFKCSLIRNSFLIEPVNDDVTSTKFSTRWNDSLDGDVRFASYDTCVKIFNKLLNKIATLESSDFNTLTEFFNYTVIAYELPIDYIDRFASPIHTPENIDLFLNEDIKNCITMRKFVKDTKRNPESTVFQRILADKIHVKTYLTDRAQTGDYKTNREKRWEAHPNSVQYALRRTCMKIETKLLLQIATFEGCNSELIKNLKQDGLLSEKFNYCKCPITGDIIQYKDFADDALNPIHGKSKFQVGHLNPLKASDTDGASGHTADNISWISENGNRIQGSLSISEVDELLKRIYKNRPELRV